MEGIRDAQVVYPKPDIKKNIAVAILIVLGDWAKLVTGVKIIVVELDSKSYLWSIA